MGTLRFLALHGHHGSGAVLRSQMAALAGPLADLVRFEYVDAPSLAAGDFGWWHAGEEHGHMRYRGWERTRDWSRAYVAANGPFDGVFGFSQGAALAALVVGLGALGGGPAFGGAIIVGGFASDAVDHAPLYEALRGADVPSLHVIGRADGIVPPARSRQLAARFADATVAEHEGGHVVAATPRIVAAARELVQRVAARRGAGAASPRPVSRSPGGAARSPAPTLPSQVALWPDRAHPAMRLYAPARAAAGHARAALIVLRGGGYARSDGSGEGSAAWAAQQGLVGVEVDYRTDGAAFPQAYADAARAVRLVRSHAAEWGIDPERVAVLGYSAGGHLASLLSTQPLLPTGISDDLAARWSARPDAVALAYPLLSFVEGYAPGAFVGSVERFFGRRADAAERRAFSSELHVDAGHPPAFVWTTADDPLVPASHSQRFADACRRAGVPVELTLYPHGPHGMGLALDRPGDVGKWTTRLLAWLTRRWGPL